MSRLFFLRKKQKKILLLIAVPSLIIGRITLGCDLMQKRNSPSEQDMLITVCPDGSVMLGSFSGVDIDRDLLHSKILDKAHKKAKKDGMVFLKALKIVIRRYGFIPKVL